MQLERYWLAREGQTFGPYDVTTLRRMRTRGEVAEGDQLCLEGTQDWMEALPAMDWLGKPMQQTEMPSLGGTSFVVNAPPLPTSADGMVAAWKAIQDEERKRSVKQIDSALAILTACVMVGSCIPVVGSLLSAALPVVILAMLVLSIILMVKGAVGRGFIGLAMTVIVPLWWLIVQIAAGTMDAMSRTHR